MQALVSLLKTQCLHGGRLDSARPPWVVHDVDSDEHGYYFHTDNLGDLLKHAGQKMTLSRFATLIQKELPTVEFKVFHRKEFNNYIARLALYIPRKAVEPTIPQGDLCPYCEMVVKDLYQHFDVCPNHHEWYPNYHEGTGNYNKIVWKEESPLLLVFGGDFHVGQRYTDLVSLERDINMVQKIPNARLVLLGDLMDNVTRHAPGTAGYDAVMSPQEQYDYLVDLLSPLSHKIICAVMGNHSHRTKKDTGLDIFHFLERQLRIVNLRNNGLLQISINHVEYNIGITHHFSGGMYHRQDKFYDKFLPLVLDAAVMGHDHRPRVWSCLKGVKAFYYLVVGQYSKRDDFATTKFQTRDATGIMPALFLSGTHKFIVPQLDFKDYVIYKSNILDLQ